MRNPTQSTKTPVKFIYTPKMYAWIGRKKGGGIKLYSWELRNSLSQIANHGTLPHIDFEYGFQSLQFVITEKFKDQHNVARIYGIRNKDENIILMEYRNGKVVIDKTPDFHTEAWIKHKDKIIRQIQDGVHNADEVYEISNLKRNLKKPKL